MGEASGGGGRALRTDYLARVEGEGAMYVQLEGGEVRDVRLRIYEPPRFFEAFLRGRGCEEVVDITARICGICPVAYQLASSRAVEAACGVALDDGPIRDLRRLLLLGEWIESHALHIHLLHAPDFLGYPGFVEMARDHPELAERGLALKQVGNTVMRLIGGREIHPVNLRLGGFYRLPTRRELQTLLDPLERARELAAATVAWAQRLPFPELERDLERVALRDPGGRYPVDLGAVVSDRGLALDAAGFSELVVEEHLEHSNALHASLRGRGTYLTGPMARYAVARGALSAEAAAAARAAAAECRNPFHSIVVRAVEVLHACEESLALVRAYLPPDRPAVPVVPRRGVGHGAVEAPRGLLLHRYAIDQDGTIRDARIVPPTSQNQRAIEEDLRAVVQAHADLDDAALTLLCEQAIRNHDPCISCATHFLELTVERR